MRRFFWHRGAVLGCLVVLSALALAPSALAAPAAGSHRAGASTTTGYLEICKYSDPTNPVTGSFNFTVDGSIPVTVAVNTCTAPMLVPAGTNTVVETPVPYAAVESIDTIPAYQLISSDLPSGTATVNVPGGDISTTTTVDYTNVAVTGYVEVCKQAALGSGLTGSFQFQITGAMGFSTIVTVPVGACSDSIQVPAGQVNVQEVGSPATYVTDIEAIPSSALLSADLPDALATVAVTPGDVSTESIVTFTNNTSRLKICKVAGDPSLVGQVYSFDVGGETLSVPAGPPPGGTCVMDPNGYTAGTQLTITEANSPGTQVSDISVAPAGRVVGTPDLVNRTVSVILGSGETDVTYTNVPAPPGLLKICKIAGAGVTTGSLWNFTVSGTAGTTTVPAGSCAIVGYFPFNSTQTVTEATVAGFGVTSIAANPVNRLAGTPDLASQSGSFVIGTGVTEALFTNAAVAGGGGGTGTGGTGTGGSGSHGSGTGSGSGSGSGGKGGSGSTTHGTARGVSTAHVAMARLVERNDHFYALVKVRSSAKHVLLRVVELNKWGHVLRSFLISVPTGRREWILIPRAKGLAHLRVRPAA